MLNYLLHFNFKKVANWLLQTVVPYLIAYITPMRDFATCIFILIVVELITSCWRAHKEGNPCDIKSLLQGFIRKFGGYFFALSVCVLSDKTLSIAGLLNM